MSPRPAIFLSVALGNSRLSSISAAMGSSSAMASRPGTRSRMAAPSRAGTAAPVTGSGSIEMVPPVKTTATRGRSAMVGFGRRLLCGTGLARDHRAGDDLDRPLEMFVGAAANPFADPFEIRVPRLAKKVAAGVEFIQTQCIYNLDKFEEWMKGVRDRGLHEKCYILAGLTPMKSVGMARYMKNRVPGMDVPDEIVQRLGDTPKEKQAEEGIKICIESIERLKQVEGVAGFHIMAIEWEEMVPQIVDKGGLYPRPQVD